MEIPYLQFCQKFSIAPVPAAPGELAYNVVWKFSLPISAAELWPYISDTSNFNRQLGLAPREETEVEGRKHVKTTLIGFPQSWIEEPWTWVSERSIQSNRVYLHGIAKRVQSNFILDPTPTGVDFYVNFSWILHSRLGLYFLKWTGPLLKKNFNKNFSLITSYVSENKSRAPMALQLPNDPSKNVDLVTLEKTATQLKEMKLNSAAVDGVCEFIRVGEDRDLFRMAVLPLAKKLQVPQQDVLKVCLESVRLGLLSLTWDVVCPHCRGVRLSAESLGQIPAKADCDVCEVDFKTDSAESIEVVFHVQPTIRKVSEILFCAAEPAKKSHIRLQQNLQPTQQVDFHQELVEGSYRVRTTDPAVSFQFEVQKTAPNVSLTWSLDQRLEKFLTGPHPTFHFKNESHQKRVLSLEEMWWKQDILRPADIFALPEYRDILSKESLQADVKISMGVQVLMFTDIVNSTNFYHQKGDAAAFNEVKSHFVDTFGAVHRHQGSVIKTIGDSTMACFTDPNQAFEAAVEIQNIFSQERADTSIRLRISLHVGQVIAVHLLNGLDLFGTTVNEAAKLQTCANSGEIAYSKKFKEALDAQRFQKFARSTVLRKSQVIFRDEVLEGYVLNCHEYHKAVSTRAA